MFGCHRAFWLWYGVLILEQANLPMSKIYMPSTVHAGGLRLLTLAALFMETLVSHQSHGMYRSTCHFWRATSIQRPLASGLLSLVSVCGSLTKAEGQTGALENAAHTSCRLGTEYKDSSWICDFVVPLLWAMACVIWRIKWLDMWKNSIPGFLVIYLSFLLIFISLYILYLPFPENNPGKAGIKEERGQMLLSLRIASSDFCHLR